MAKGKAGTLEKRPGAGTASEPWESQERGPWSPTAFPAAVVGVLCAIEDAGEIQVELPEGGEVVTARSCVPITSSDLGRKCVLVFENGDVSRPILLGLLQDPTAAPPLPRPEPASYPDLVRYEGQRIIVTADRCLELRCGRASITLSRDGTLEIRGVNLLSRASGTNKIRGGTVHLN